MCENVFVQRQLYFKGIPAWSGMDFQGLTLTYFYARAVREWLQTGLPQVRKSQESQEKKFESGKVRKIQEKTLKVRKKSGKKLFSSQDFSWLFRAKEIVYFLQKNVNISV